MYICKLHMYIYIYIYIYMHTYIHTYIHIYIERERDVHLSALSEITQFVYLSTKNSDTAASHTTKCIFFTSESRLQY